MNDIGKMKLPGLLGSFGDIQERDWARLKRPYIAVFHLGSGNDFYEEHGMRYCAKLYDGAYYVGYHRVARTLEEICDDIEKNYPMLQQYQRGAEDPEELICAYAGIFYQD